MREVQTEDGGGEGSRRGVVGKNSVKEKKSRLDKHKNIKAKRQKEKKTDLQ